MEFEKYRVCDNVNRMKGRKIPGRLGLYVSSLKNSTPIPVWLSYRYVCVYYIYRIIQNYTHTYIYTYGIGLFFFLQQ